ncbi:hypothetical protein [Natronogracilivirga saccharolytica]|uniref:DUF1611 domain-containing protein n=1 Tax=Natronogracilivirga saccharolytica TaxID=2812953 RepID=A0A8J7S7H7_9BACT|nr:hypothetical protein [Natronogracilivirga saccharolytica]MBP3191633.1 hypothetical protein [Natronogracilivirga saccharolytica]
MGLKEINADIIASSSASVKLDQTVKLAPNIVAEEGYLVAVKTLDVKDRYNKIETSEGAIIPYGKDQIVIGALGERQALRGYSGIIPRSVKKGDTLHILNMGGIVGHCQSPHPDHGPAMRVEVLGAVMIPDEEDQGMFKHACIQDYAIEWEYQLTESVPLIAVTGTCMHVGKTMAATMIVRQLAAQGYKVAAAKLTGASLMRDTREMKENGAIASAHFGMAGLVSTTGKNILPMAKGLIKHLNSFNPDAIILEFGDGIIGAYGVDSLLMDKEMMQFTRTHVVAAQDFMGCWSADHFFRKRYTSAISIITGPVTDNLVGVQFIQNTLGIRAVNAVAEPQKLGDMVSEITFAAPTKKEPFI